MKVIFEESERETIKKCFDLLVDYYNKANEETATRLQTLSTINHLSEFIDGHFLTA